MMSINRFYKKTISLIDKKVPIKINPQYAESPMKMPVLSLFFLISLGKFLIISGM